MELKLDERYKITTDKAKMNFQLEELVDIKDKESGEIIRQDWKILGYHGGHINHAIKQYVREVIINSDQEFSIESLLEKLDELYKHIDIVVKKQNITFEVKEEKNGE
jgi:phage replication-related protein YjqB (UPF0714/DUF867 family)